MYLGPSALQLISRCCGTDELKGQLKMQSVLFWGGGHRAKGVFPTETRRFANKGLFRSYQGFMHCSLCLTKMQLSPQCCSWTQQMESPSIGPSRKEPISSVVAIEWTFSLSHLKQAKQMISPPVQPLGNSTAPPAWCPALFCGALTPDGSLRAKAQMHFLSRPHAGLRSHCPSPDHARVRLPPSHPPSSRNATHTQLSPWSFSGLRAVAAQWRTTQTTRLSL